MKLFKKSKNEEMKNTNLRIVDAVVFRNSTATASSLNDIPPWLFSLLMEYLSYAMICVAIFGIPGNILVIATYLRIGFAESINISYCALGVSDILCVVFLSWNAVCFMPTFAHSSIPIIAREVVILTGGFTSIIFCDITAWITAFISLERCLCVVYPLKIKSIVTHKRTVFVIIAIFTITAIPLTTTTFYLHVFEFRFDAERNESVLGVAFRNNVPAVVFVHNFNQIYKLVVLNLLPYTTILVCSLFLAVYLDRSVSWRAQNSGSTIHQANDGSVHKVSTAHRKQAKEIRVAKTVLSLATAFLFLGTLSSLRLLISIIWPEFRPLATYDKFFRLLGRVGFLLSLANSSVNFLIYYTMGSKFKQTVKDMLPFRTKVEQEN